MGYLSFVIFYLKCNCHAWVYILKFCRLKIASGDVDARKWSAKWRNWNISNIFFPLSSIEGQKRQETSALCMGIMPSEGAQQENGFFFYFKEDRFDISDTPRSGRSSGFNEDRLNTLIHNDPRQCNRELANVMNCDHSTNVRLLHSRGKSSKIGCMGTACSKPKPQK